MWTGFFEFAGSAKRINMKVTFEFSRNGTITGSGTDSEVGGGKIGSWQVLGTLTGNAVSITKQYRVFSVLYKGTIGSSKMSGVWNLRRRSRNEDLIGTFELSLTVRKPTNTPQTKAVESADEDPSIKELSENLAKLILGNMKEQGEARKNLIKCVEAIIAFDAETLQHLREIGADANQRLPNGDFPIHACAKLRSNACAMLIALQQGLVPLDVNVQNSKGDTALHIACQLVDPDAVKHLLGNHADPNLSNLDGSTPLHIACKMRAPELARQLLEDKRTDPSLKNKDGKAANQLDDVSELTEIIELFLERGLSREGAAKGTIEVALSWDNLNDLDLHVICPHGFKIHYGQKQAPCCAGELDVDMNAGGPQSEQPVEHIYWKNSPPTGKYQVYVDHYSVKCLNDTTKFFVNLRVNDVVVWKTQNSVTHNSSSERCKLVHTFTYPN